MKELPPVALLAGGLATRLKHLTETMPKALVNVNGRPFIVHQLARLCAEGISRIVCCVGYKGEMIEELIGDGKKFGIHVSYSYDGEKLLGTGGAIKKAIGLLGSPFFVLYGDSYLRLNYRQVHEVFEKEGKKGLLTIYKNRGRWDASNIHYTGRQIVAYSKKEKTPAMAYIDYGLSLLRSEAFDDYPPQQAFDLAKVYEKLVHEDQLAPFEVAERFYEIGSFDGLREIESFLETGRENQ